jgi:hypothetical protein
MMRRILIGLLVVLVLIGVVIALRQPSGDRIWKDYLSRPAIIEVTEDNQKVRMRDVRDWKYDENGPVSREYVDRDYTVASLTKLWFVVEPFPEDERFGHTLLTFEFSDAPPISFSVEALLEEGESYSAWKGLWNEYELAYTWGTEQDFLTRRAVMLGHDIRLYEVKVPRDVAQAVFLSFVARTQELAEKPAFYNTLAHNCTNELVHVVNERMQDALPFDLSRFLTGTADEYLYRLGYVGEGTWEETLKDADVTGRVRELASDPDFSGKLH